MRPACRLGVERKILIGAGARRAMRENIDRDAAPVIGKPLDQPVPEMTVQENAMNKNRHGTRSGLPVCDVSEVSRDIFIAISRKRVFRQHFNVSLVCDSVGMRNRGGRPNRVPSTALTPCPDFQK
jgi:hypothetical protein